MNITINGKAISQYCISMQDYPSVKTAAAVFNEYAKKITGSALNYGGGENLITFALDKNCGDEHSIITLKGSRLSFSGGKRGVIYAVMTFLEEYFGVTFLTHYLETLPESDINLSGDINYSYEPPIKFRCYLGNADLTDEFSLRRKLNSNLWDFHKLSEKEGGGYSYAGIPAHTLTGEFILAPYTQSNPEFFSLVNGVRRNDRYGQVCPTNKDALKATVHEIKKLLRQNPEKNMVSVSQGDNNNYCGCENCLAANAKSSMSEVYSGFVNDVAYEVGKEFPNVLIHTFAYGDTLSPPEKLKYRDNVLLQYCTGNHCKVHSYGDTDCEINAAAKGVFEKFTKVCDTVFIWEYANVFKYQLFIMPDQLHLHKNLKFFADKGVKGFFTEANHRETDGFCAFNELNCYLYSHVMYNPYMTDETYLNLIFRFIKNYYGDGNGYIYEILKLCCKPSAQYHVQYNLGDFSTKFITELDPGGFPVSERLPERMRKQEEVAEFCEKINLLWDKAYAAAKTDAQRDRIERTRVSALYYEMFWTMDIVMQNGTAAQKAEILKKNAYLVKQIEKYKLKITFWGEDIQSQLQRMREENYALISPAKWRYRW